MSVEISIIESVRLATTCNEKVVALSLLDCTTANFAPASVIWLYQPPQSDKAKKLSLGRHLRDSLAFVLRSHPQWCGHLRAVDNINGIVPAEAQHLPPHARRFRRLYAHFGTPTDPGVEFVQATSSAMLASLYPAERTTKHPLWSFDTAAFARFMARSPLANPLEPDAESEAGRRRPLLAVQVTELVCGSFVLAVKGAHPLADASTVIALVRDWALVSRAVLQAQLSPQLSPVFDPALLDSHAAGNIDVDQPDAAILQQAARLPMHRYDWWASAKTAPWPMAVPAPFDADALEPAGKTMPWAEWDLTAPVSSCVVHLSRDQVDCLWCAASRGVAQRLSRHDAVVGHIWSCICRARGLAVAVATETVHCDLVYGARPSFQLSGRFVGSPTVMMDVALPASEVTDAANLPAVAAQIRQTLQTIAEPSSLAAHLHSIAFDTSPQRTWQAFLGQRHILVTTWARAGIYGIDFGFGSVCSYAEGVVPNLDGDVLVKEAPGGPSAHWSDNGVDVTLHICTADMQRLLRDPILFLGEQ